MSKESSFKMDGLVIEILPNAMFRVKIENVENIIIGVISGKMRQQNIKILLGDRVEVEFSPYDLARGRITRRK